MKLGNRALSIAVTLSLVLASQATAQDAQYWTYQYGTRAQLLTGVAAGSILDLSSTFYNPGALVLVDVTVAVLTAYNFDFSDITIKNGAGSGEDLSSLTTNTSPGFIAGSLTFDLLHSHRLAYSYLARQKLRLDLNTRLIESRDTDGDGTPDEHFAGEMFLKQNVDENWGGLTWSRRLGERAGIGLTPYGAYRSQSTRFQTVVQFAEDSGNGASSTLINDFSYWNFRTLLKAGICFDYAPLTFGFTLTTPSLNLVGSGKSFVNASLIGLDTDNDGIEDSELASNYQEGLSATYKTSWALAAGLSYRLAQTTLHFSTEWFNAVDPYDILAIDPFQGQTSGTTISPRARDAANSLINFGVGVEHHMSDTLSLYGSFATDYSSYSPDSDMTVSSWDIYHLTIGATFVFYSVEFTMGIERGRGRDVLQSRIDLGTSDPDNEFLGRPSDMTVIYSRWEFILGFSFLL